MGNFPSQIAARRRRPGQEGAALMLAIIVIFVLTVLGLTLLFTTTTEFQIAGAETTVNKAFYAADSGVQYGILQGKEGKYSGSGYTDPTTSVVYPSYWGFGVPQQNIGSAAAQKAISVRVTPFRQVDLAKSPLSEIQQGAVVFYNIGWHLDSYAQSFKPDNTLDSQKQISVDFTIGPVPWTPSGL